MGIFSEARLAFHNEKAKQQKHRNNHLDNCFACALIELPLKALFRDQGPVPQNAECLPSPPIKIPFLHDKFNLKALLKGAAPKQHKQQKEPQGTPWTPCSINFFHQGSRRSTGDSDSKDSCRSFRSRRIPYSQMVSPVGSEWNLQNSPRVDSSAIPKKPNGGSSVGCPATPVTPRTPLPPPSCCHISSGEVCEKCTDTAMTCERWISGVEAIGPTHGQEPLEFEPTPETSLATTYESQSSQLLSPGGGRPLTGLGIEMSDVTCEGRGSLLANPSSPPLTPPPLASPPPTPSPATKKRKERPAPVLTTYNLPRNISWKLEKNYDTASGTATPSSRYTRATFAPAPVQNVSQGRSTFEVFREMSCTLEHCGIHGEDRSLSTTAATIVGSSRDSDTTLAGSLHSQSEGRRPVYQTDYCASKYFGRWKHGSDWDMAAATMIGSKRDSGATLAASMHSGSEDRPECKQHPKGMYCAPKHYERCQVGAENRLELTENKRRVSRIVDGLVTALTKGISWLREKGWR